MMVLACSRLDLGGYRVSCIAYCEDHGTKPQRVVLCIEKRLSGLIVMTSFCTVAKSAYVCLIYLEKSSGLCL